MERARLPIVSTAGRWNAGLWIASLWLLCGCEGSGGGGRAPEFSRSDVFVRFGPAGLQDFTAWNTITIRARNTGADFDGAIEVVGEAFDRDGHPDQRPVRYSVPAEIPGGATGEVTIPVRPDLWMSVRVSFRQPGYAKSHRIDLNVTPFEYRMLAVSDRGVGLGFLPEWLKASYLEPMRAARTGTTMNVYVDPNAQKSATQNAQELFSRRDLASVASVRASELPELPEAYAPFHCIVLQGTSLRDAPPAAFRGLRRWVERGGVLIALPGVGWSGGLPDEFLELLGVRPGDPEAPPPARVASALGSLGADGIAYRELFPAAGATSVDGGLAISRALGTGRVLVFTASDSRTVFPRPESAPRVYAALVPAVEHSLGALGAMEEALDRFEAVAPSALFQMSGFLIPGAGQIALALLAYVVLGFLLPGWIFKRLRRREWTFAVIVAAAVVATVAIYFFGALSTRDELTMEEITLLRAHADGATAEATSFVGLMSPALDSVTVLSESAGGDSRARWPRPQPVRGRSTQYGYVGEELSIPSMELDVDPYGRLRLPDIRLYPNDMRCLRFDYVTSLAGLLEISHERLRDGSPLRTRVRNTSGESLELFVVRGDRAAILGPLASGASTVPDFDASSRFETTNRSAIGYLFGNAPRDLLRTIVRQAIGFPNEIEHQVGVYDQSDPDPGRTGIFSMLRGRRPDYLVAISQRPVLEAHESIRARHALTACIVEIPPGAENGPPGGRR